MIESLSAYMIHHVNISEVGNSAGRRGDGNAVDEEFARRLGLAFHTEAFRSSQETTHFKSFQVISSHFKSFQHVH